VGAGRNCKGAAVRCRIPARWVLGAALVALVLAARPARAFDSFPWGAPHDRITRAAALELGWSKNRTQALVDGVRASDWEEAAWKPRLFPPRRWFRVAPNDTYDPAHHFDRARGSTHAQAFESGVRFVRGAADSAVVLARRGEWERAVSAMGAGVHAIQDLASHSNLIDLPAEDQRLVAEAVFGSDDVVAPGTRSDDVVVPAELRLTGYDADAPDPESPPGDEYSHREFSKDNRRKNRESERTEPTGVPKFERAVEAAGSFTVRWMESIRARLTDEEWRRLGEIET
jgi:hypothetical protein